MPFAKMSCIHNTTCQLACSPPASQSKRFQLNTSSPAYSGTRLPKISLKSTRATSQAATVCLFGGKGKFENENQASPWNVLEKAVGNVKKDQSIEDALKQQVQKQEYYDGGDGGEKGPGGGGWGGGDGSGQGEDEGLSGVWYGFGQVILATMGFIFIYVCIIDGKEITVLAKDFLRLVFTWQKSIRLRRLVDQWSEFFRMMREKRENEDPHWLEREIINTLTCYDHRGNYKWLIKVLESNSDDE